MARVQSPSMSMFKKTSWIWFAGCAAWTVDGVVSVSLHSRAHAQLAFLVAMVFLAAGVFYRKQSR